MACCVLPLFLPKQLVLVGSYVHESSGRSLRVGIPAWILMGPYTLGPCGWASPFGSLWGPVGTYGPLCLGSLRAGIPAWAPMAPYGPLCVESLQAGIPAWAPYGILWAPMGPYGLL